MLPLTEVGQSCLLVEEYSTGWWDAADSYIQKEPESTHFCPGSHRGSRREGRSSMILLSFTPLPPILPNFHHSVSSYEASILVSTLPSSHSPGKLNSTAPQGTQSLIICFLLGSPQYHHFGQLPMEAIFCPGFLVLMNGRMSREVGKQTNSDSSIVGTPAGYLTHYSESKSEC